MKIGQLQEQLKKSLESQNEKVLSNLEKNLEKEWKEMEKRIEKNILKQNQELLEQVKQSLKNIDWELEYCRTAKHWKWAIGGGLVTIIILIALLKISWTQQIIINIINWIIG